jgi:undecaprenyl-diphosphatase
MSIVQAFWLGLVQGLGEFLPISSTGHLDLLQKIFGFTSLDNYMTLDILLHVGTLAAVVVVYWKRLWNMIVDLFKNPLKSEIWLLIVATIPAVVVALVFDINFTTESLGFEFLITTLIIWLADLVSGVSFETKEVKWYNALAMGVMQAVAILPGVSRSGATISGGIATGLSRKRSADFAFLMSVPAVLGAIVLDLWKHSDKVMDGTMVAQMGGWMPLLVGVITSAVFGFLAIKFMLSIVRRVRLTWFGVYTGILGILILLDQYIFHYFF